MHAHARTRLRYDHSFWNGSTFTSISKMYNNCPRSLSTMFVFLHVYIFFFLSYGCFLLPIWMGINEWGWQSIYLVAEQAAHRSSQRDNWALYNFSILFLSFSIFFLLLNACRSSLLLSIDERKNTVFPLWCWNGEINKREANYYWMVNGHTIALKYPLIFLSLFLCAINCKLPANCGRLCEPKSL